MFCQLRRHFKQAFPIRLPLLAFAVAVGLVAGAFYLDESEELATAVGLVACISLAVGSWLGLGLYLITARGFAFWIETIRKRISAVELRLITGQPSNFQDTRQRPQRSLALRIVLASAYATPVCLVMVAIGVIATALSTQLGSLFVAVTLRATLFSLSVLLVAVVIQSLYLWRLQRRVVSLDQRLDRIDAVSPITLRASVLDSSINRTERVVRRLTGVGKPIAEQATA